MASRPRNGSTPPLHAHAAALLRRRDIDGYRALFADAAALDDPTRRYIDRCHLVNAAVGHRGVGAAVGVRAGAEELLTVLEQEPAEPVLLNQAGVLLSLLDAFVPARALFEAAMRLDPELPKLQGNLEEVIRLQAELPHGQVNLYGALGRRAEAVAERARPAEGMSVSLCMIVKDEEEMLPRSLAAAAPFVDEIVIVDTGSSDRTIEIAKSYGARVIEREWTGSFSEARNVGLDAATGDWLLILDADEVLVADDAPHLRTLLGQTWREAFYISAINFTGELDDGTATMHSTVRMFRNRPEHRYRGRLHEQIVEVLPAGAPERFRTVPIRIEHYGYLGAVRDAKEKSRRNIELLERQRDEGDTSAFMHFNLGSEYGALGDAEAALVEFECAAEQLKEFEVSAGFVAALTSRHVRALRVCGRLEDAIARADEALERFPGFTDLVVEQASAAVRLGRIDDAIAYYERCIEMGDAPSRYTATVGMGTYLPTIALAEIRHQQGDPATAVELLDAALVEHPGFFGLVLPFAAALLDCGTAPDAVVARVEERVAKLTPTVRFMLGTALYEAGETVAAEAQYRSLLEQQPSSGPARVALAEALLSQRRWEEAAATAAALDDEEPHAAAARRSELFARIVVGDLTGAAAVLGRAEPDDAEPVLDADDRALFGGWLAAAGGTPEDSVLPIGAVGPLAVTLEALLRVQEVDAFETLVGLLDRCPIAPREQRELRAAMYLRRGFLASAAEEWLAVCGSDATDVRALVGLAHVALGQGMTDEALDFAREANALDPGDARATRLLQRLEPLAA